MTNRDQHDGKDIRDLGDPEGIMPAFDGELYKLGADPKLITTVKAWAPGKPPGGEIPPRPQPEAKAPKDKS